MVVGVLDPDGTQRVIGFGTGAVGADLPHAESVFEIGSLTKVFTGILLADMVLRGEVDPAEPVARLLPAEVRIPSRSGRQITLLDLATHTSGLPIMPGNFPVGDVVRAYADYDTTDLFDFLASYELDRDPGEVYQYSNLLSLLGHALSYRSGIPYEELLRERVLEPLGMHGTAIVPTERMERYLTQGHSAEGDPEPYFVTPAFEPSGGLKSTMMDMLRFSAAHLSDEDTDVHAALRDATRPRRRVNDSDDYVGLAWGTNDQGTMVGHSGGTFGYGSYVNIDMEAGRAIVVLTNFAGRDANLVGVHLLDPASNPRPQGR
jgi:serine-type D-Ala-D-Ala carboxypeptidase/endopeptidase